MDLTGVKLLKFGPDGMPKKAGHVTCFPTACAAANSWDRGLVYKLGETLGQEAQLEGTGVSLSPAVNIKRHPLCAEILSIIRKILILPESWGPRRQKVSEPGNAGKPEAFCPEQSGVPENNY